VSRKRTASSVKKSCDRLWSRVVRSGGCCERCGATPEKGRGFHAHHVYGRGNHRLRWEPRNGVALCGACHMWAEQAPLAFAEWFGQHRSEDVEFLAEQHALGIVKRTMADYLDLEYELKEETNGSDR
jgi:hypothetical protein